MLINAELERDQPRERRWVIRYLYQLPAVFRAHGRNRISARILDLSKNGCRIELDRALAAGERVSIRLSGLESRSALVVWSKQGEAGLEFEQPLHPAVVRMLVLRANVSGPDGLPLTRRR